MVGKSRFVHQGANASYSHGPENELAPHAEMVLPSIEGNSSNVKDQRAPSPDQGQRINPYVRLRDYRPSLQHRIPSTFYLSNEEQLRNKRRKVDDYQSFDQQRQETILIPLDGRDGSRSMHPPPAAEAYHNGMPLSAPDNRIVQISPTKARGHEDAQRFVQMSSLPGQRDNRLFYQRPHEQSSLHFVGSLAPGQPQSPRSSVAFQSASANRSPYLSHVSAPLRPEHSNLHHPARRASRNFEGDAQAYPASQAMFDHVQDVQKVENKQQDDLRPSEINVRRHWDYDLSRSSDTLRKSREPPLLPPSGMPNLSHERYVDAHMVGEGVHRPQPRVYPFSAQRDLQYRPLVHTELFEHDNERIAKESGDISQRPRNHLPHVSGGRSFQSLQGVDHWSDRGGIHLLHT